MSATTDIKILMMHAISQANSEDSQKTPINMRFFEAFQPALSRVDDWTQATSAQVWRGKPGQKNQGIATITSRLKKTPLRVIYREAFEYDPQDPESTLVHPLETGLYNDPWTIVGVRLIDDESGQDIAICGDIQKILMHSILSEIDYAYLEECLIQKHKK